MFGMLGYFGIAAKPRAMTVSEARCLAVQAYPNIGYWSLTKGWVRYSDLIREAEERERAAISDT